MIIQNTVNDLIRVATSTANALDVLASFVDSTSTTAAAQRQRTAIAAAATTTVVAAPAAATERVLKNLSFCARGGANGLIVFWTDGTTIQLLGGAAGIALGAGETLVYTDTEGWRVHDANGAIKTVASQLAGHLIRVDGVDQTQRAAMNLIDSEILVTPTDDGANNETELRFTIATSARGLLRAPQIVLATNAAFAHPVGTRLLVVEGVGGGGASAGAGAAAGSVGNGGNSGNWGRKTFSSVSGTSNITIGAGGTAGAAGAAGNNGGNSSMVHNAVTFTLPGGIGGVVLAGAATIAQGAANAGNAASTGADIDIVGELGGQAYRNAAVATAAVSGEGGSNPLGQGGKGVAGANAASLPGLAGKGFGAGASGRNNGNTAVATAGIAGQPGAFIIWEFS